MDLLSIAHGFLLAWFFAYFEPLQDFIRGHIRPAIPERYSYLRNSFACIKCLSFWFTGFITLDLYSAIAAALIAFVFERLIYSFKVHI